MCQMSISTSVAKTNYQLNFAEYFFDQVYMCVSLAIWTQSAWVCFTSCLSGYIGWKAALFARTWSIVSSVILASFTAAGLFTILTRGCRSHRISYQSWQESVKTWIDWAELKKMALRGFSKFEQMFRAKLASDAPLHVLKAKKEKEGLSKEEVRAKGWKVLRQ